MLECKCKVDVLSASGNTALMFACKENKLPTIQLLLENGLYPNKKLKKIRKKN
jgi:ankyrin repeat protein